MFKKSNPLTRLAIAFAIFSFHHISPDQLSEFQEKEQQMESLIERADAFIASHNISQAAHEFINNLEWQSKNLFIFLIGSDGYCRSFGPAKELIWYNFANKVGLANEPLIDQFIKYENKTVSFGYNTQDFHNRTVYARLKKISHAGKNYILGCGFYINNSLYAAIALTRKAAGIIENNGLKKTCEIINNPMGKMIIGDVYLFIINTNNIILAHGRDRVRVGHYLFDDDPAAAYFKKRSKDIMAFVDGNKKSYLTPASKNTVDQIYMEKHIDPQTKTPYTIGAVFHPMVNEKMIISLVQKTIDFLKNTKLEPAFNEMASNKTKFKIGGSFVSVYDFDGLCLANGESPLYVGTNRKDFIDEFGQNPLNTILKKLQNPKTKSTWITTFIGNAPKLIYAERLDLPEISLAIISGFWPSSQETLTKYMVESAAQLIEEHDLSKAIKHIAKGKADFLQGSTYPIICDEKGITLFEGPYDKNSIWKNLSQRTPFVRDIIETVIAKGNAGGGWTTKKWSRGTSKNYVKKVEKKIVSGKILQIFISAYYYI